MLHLGAILRIESKNPFNSVNLNDAVKESVSRTSVQIVNGVKYRYIFEFDFTSIVSVWHRHRILFHINYVAQVLCVIWRSVDVASFLCVFEIHLPQVQFETSL